MFQNRLKEALLGAGRGFQLNFQFSLSVNSHKIEFFAKIYSIFRPNELILLQTECQSDSVTKEHLQLKHYFSLVKLIAPTHTYQPFTSCLILLLHCVHLYSLSAIRHLFAYFHFILTIKLQSTLSFVSLITQNKMKSSAPKFIPLVSVFLMLLILLQSTHTDQMVGRPSLKLGFLKSRKLNI